MPLNTVQVAFVNESARPMVESLIRYRSELEAFVLQFDNQQDAIPTSAVALDDNSTGTAPRDDAPLLTGQRVSQLRTFANDMFSQIDSVALDILVSLAVRPVGNIIRD